MVNFVSDEVKLDFSDVRLVPSSGGPSSRKLVNLTTGYLMPHSGEHMEGVGVIAANMDGVGTFEVAEVLATKKMFTALHKNYSADDLIGFFQKGAESLEKTSADFSFYSLGIGDADYQKLATVSKQTPIHRVCIDVANGYMSEMYDFISLIRETYPMTTIMAGNVVTPEAVEAMYKAGADIVKLGIGPGAMCTTRLVTGVGYPQFSCIVDSVQAADECGIFLCSDGGCSVSGDVAIAMGAGADFVMLGSMLAGTDESGGQIVDGKVEFYGMSSKTANDKHFGGLKNYRSSEGRTVMLPYKGRMDDVASQILGGLASACTYSGCRALHELQSKAKFIKVNNTHNRAYEKFTTGN